MVEKWLIQVEEMMLASIRKVMVDSIAAYLTIVREKWVLDWPGQVIHLEFLIQTSVNRPLVHVSVVF